MTKKMTPRATKREGFTLIELLVVVLIIGILAASGAPQYAKVVERGKAAEAVQFVRAVQGAQARYFNKYGTYCTGAVTGCAGFDLTVTPFKYFGVMPNVTAGTGTPSWKVVLTRNVTTANYGAYAITFDVEPNAAPALTCSNASCTNELLPKNF